MFPELDRELRDKIKLLPESLKLEIERISGVPLDDSQVKYEDLITALQVTADSMRHERDYQEKRELVQQFVDGIVGGLAKMYQEYLTFKSQELYLKGEELALMERNGRLAGQGLEKIALSLSGIDETAKNAIVGYLGTTYLSLLAQKQNTQALQAMAASMGRILPSPMQERMLPEHAKGETPRYKDLADCVYQHPDIQAPRRCVYIFENTEGLGLICSVPNQAYKRTFLGWHWLSGDKLKEQGCPLYASRGIIQRFFPHQRCMLADGKMHRMDMAVGEGSIWPLSV
ncbi:MAG: hypothetical protein V1743_02080 [Nanoarchaeota archaeon]